MLKVVNLSKNFGLTPAVENVSFEVKSGEIFSLIGPNGSGKTTIIKITAGLLQPTSGEVLVSGLNVTKEPVKTKSQIGYIPDEPVVWSAMTGEEFLQFTATLYGIAEKLKLQRIASLLPVFKLNGIKKRFFEDYSRGNKQKFAILAALLHEPKLLLIDEPIVGLDPESAHTAKELIGKFAGQGGAVLMATHTLPVAAETSTKIGLLKAGKLVNLGTLAELRSQAGLKDGASLEDIYSVLT